MLKWHVIVAACLTAILPPSSLSFSHSLALPRPFLATRYNGIASQARDLFPTNLKLILLWVSGGS